MKPSGSIRQTLRILGLWMLLALAAHAGTFNQVFLPQDNLPQTTEDDMYKAVGLQWHKLLKPVRFYYIRSSNGKIVDDSFIPDTTMRDPIDVYDAMSRALKTWNNTKMGKGGFFDETLVAGDQVIKPSLTPNPNPQFLRRAEIDGFNVITFRAQDTNAVTGDDLANTRLTYFYRDFNMQTDWNNGVRPSYLGQLTYTNQGRQQQIQIQFGLNRDYNFDTFIPFTDYKQGDILDADIVFNTNITDEFRAWPEDSDKIDPSLKNLYSTEVIGSYDIQMILEHEFGWVRGLGNSIIFNSVMFPYYNASDYAFPTDPYKKRQLTFDDEVTLAMLDGIDGNSTLASRGAISGQILNGRLATADAVTFVGNNSLNDTIMTNMFIAQAPVMVAVDPHNLPSIELVPGSTPIVNAPGQLIDPDNVPLPNPSLNPTKRTYRAIAMVLSGQNLALPSGVGTTMDLDMSNNVTRIGTTGGGTGTGGGIGGDPNDTGADSNQGDAGTITSTTRINGNYLIPGLPPSTVGANPHPIDYYIYLPFTIRDGDVGTFPFNAAQEKVYDSYAPEEYPGEFYGGANPSLPPMGDGLSFIINDTTDDWFQDEFITGEMDVNGRVAVSINPGPALLSGFRSGPRSYITLTKGSNVYSNKLGEIALPSQPITISDAKKTALGGWQEDNQFNLTTRMQMSGVDELDSSVHAITVTHTLRNISSTTATFTLRQVLDTQLFGAENPIYVMNSKVIKNSTTFSRDQISSQVIFQSSVHEPVFRGLVQFTGSLASAPDFLTIGTLKELNRLLTGPGYDLRGLNASNLDTGMALYWQNISLNPGEVRTFSYIVGFLPCGLLHDTWLPLPSPTPMPTETPMGSATVTVTPTPVATPDYNVLFGDDADIAEPIRVKAGEVVDGIDILTNNGEAAPASVVDNTDTIVPTPLPGSGFSDSLSFRKQVAGFPTTSLITMQAAMGDIDNDGDLDIVTANVAGNTDDGQSISSINHIYLNDQRTSHGLTEYFFRDVTLGEDGVPSSFNGIHDDRLDTTYEENSMGVVMADFDGDGYLDIFFTNMGAPNRFYRNRGREKPGFFQEESFRVPGLLNFDWATNIDRPFRCTAGDIDSDGDIDIIISQYQPFFDPNLTTAWVDLSPRDPDNGNPYGDRRMCSFADLWTGELYCAERVLINQINSPGYSANWEHIEHPTQRGFYFMDETLGTDDRFGTLSSLEISRGDNPSDPIQSEWADLQFLEGWDPTQLDRMPPVFPVMHTFPPDFGDPVDYPSPQGFRACEPHLGQIFGSAALDLLSTRLWKLSFMDYDFFQIPISIPLPSPVEGDPDFYNAGTTGWRIDPAVGYGNEPGYFRNLDIFSENNTVGPDGIADGYFGCYNYNLDYGGLPGAATSPFAQAGTVQTGSGLFCDEFDPNSKYQLFRYDAFPLFIGMPQGHPADYQPQNEVEEDIVPRVVRSAWTAVIGDWENRGLPKPLIVADNEYGNPFTFTVDQVTYNASFCGTGTGRSQSFSYGGTAAQYFDPDAAPYDDWIGPKAAADWTLADMAPAADKDPVHSTPSGTRIIQDGEPFSSTAGDFDNDGDQDVFWVNSSLAGIIQERAEGLALVFGPKAIKQLIVNDSFAHFTEATNAIQPNLEKNGLYCLSGDINNDGAIDLIAFNAGEPNELFINQGYPKPPDLNSKTDPPLFHDATYATIPNVSGISNSNLPMFNYAFTGATVNAIVADLNGDHLPDLAMAEGGMFSMIGDFSRVLLNKGQTLGEGVPTFMPAGSSYPAPRTDLWRHSYPPTNYSFFGHSIAEVNADFYNFYPFYNGYLGEGYKPGDRNYAYQPGKCTDIAAADVDNDGDLDLIIARDGDGPELLTNQDSDDKMYNSVPDSDSLGDAIFDKNAGIKFTSDPNGGLPITLKNRNRKLAVADFNGDGLPDIVFANGIQNSGAPNVLLLNDPTLPGRFDDVTATNLPLTYVTGDGKTVQAFDDTWDVVVGDFDQDGDVDIIFANQSNDACPIGFRLLLNDGNGIFTESTPGSQLPEFKGRMPRAIGVGDFDRHGEWTEDTNHNGILDPDEDLDGNGLIDFIDSNSNGRWDGSLDLFVSFADDIPCILINDSANPGYFQDQTHDRFAGDIEPSPNRGVAIGDIDNNGALDIAVAQYTGGLNRAPVKLYRNVSLNGQWGYFKDISDEVPIPYSVREYNETDMSDDTFVGWANAVTFIDYDLDGDLDLFVSCLAHTRTHTDGTYDLFYVNRLIGDGFNYRVHDLQRSPGNPIIYAVQAARHRTRRCQSSRRDRREPAAQHTARFRGQHRHHGPER